MPTEEIATEVRSFLYQAYPVECEIVGDEVVEDICFGHINFVKAIGGDPFPVHDVATGMIAAANFLVALLKLRDELQKWRASKIPAPEVAARRRGDLSKLKEIATGSRVDGAKQKIAVERVFPGDEDISE